MRSKLVKLAQCLLFSLYKRFSLTDEQAENETAEMSGDRHERDNL
jgi:hypothetical protein